MLTSERRERKQGKIRNSEYYGMESIFDTLYAESKNGCYESPWAVIGGSIRNESNTGLEEEPKGGLR